VIQQSDPTLRPTVLAPSAATPGVSVATAEGERGTARLAVRSMEGGGKKTPGP
jgi:hypothetical protein